MNKHLSVAARVLATMILLGIVFVWTLFVFILLPFAIALMMHGKKKNLSGFNLAIAMSPIAVIWFLIHKLWNSDTRGSHGNFEWNN